MISLSDGQRAVDAAIATVADCRATFLGLQPKYRSWVGARKVGAANLHIGGGEIEFGLGLGRFRATRAILFHEEAFRAAIGLREMMIAERST